MNIFGKTFIPIFLVSVLVSCNSGVATPTTNQAEMMETAISTVSTALAETQRVIPTVTPISLATFPILPTISFRTTPSTPLPHSASPTLLPTIPTFTPMAFTDPSIPLSERIVYYYFVTPAENPIPEGTVLWGHPLAPAYADETYTSDTAADLRTALRIVLHDGRNFWRGSDLEIVDITLRNGHADVVLQGDYFAAGGGPLWAASMQILMTVFANPAVQTTTVSLNGGTIWNLGVSHPSNAKPDGYVYTRAETEKYMTENAYVSP